MARGQLRIYLGAAPGVGKTYAMLDEGRRRMERGTDVVVGIVETHGRAATADRLNGLEIIPRRSVEYRGTVLEEMDLDAVLARQPQVVLVDELAHTNAPGSRHAKRWEDVEELLANGLDVISTVNIQHLESISDVVEQITGVTQREVIPDAIVRSADQVQLVDQTPEALRRRMAHGNIYPPERVDAALGNYFRLGNLAALRELALMWVADSVDDSLQAYRTEHGIERPWETRERVVVALTGAPHGEHLIRRAARIAARARGDLLGVHIRNVDGLSTGHSESLEEQRALLAALDGTYHEVGSGDVAKALVQFARHENATQIVLGSSHRSRWTELAQGSVINDVTRQSGSIDVHIISTASPESSRLSLGHRRASAFAARRRMIGWLLSVSVPLVFTFLLSQFRSSLGLPSELLVLLLGVVGVAMVGGLAPAMVSAVESFLLANWFFTKPLYTLTIAQGENILALAVFLVVAGSVGFFVSSAARRSADAIRARGEAETLAALAGVAATDDDPLAVIAEQLRSTFAVESVAVLNRRDGDWVVEAGAGPNPPARPEQGTFSVPLGDDSAVALSGVADNVDLEILRAFTAQLAGALDRRRLRAEASQIEQLSQTNELRAALLAAVSHDLRTPLASIKAAASSLRQRDVEWPTEVREEFVETIDTQADRLSALITNLLGMSRIQAGAVELAARPVGFDEVVPRAVSGLNLRDRTVVNEVDETLPRVLADPALLERVIANLVDNACKWSPADQPVRLSAACSGNEVVLGVVDRGPGIPPNQRDQVFQPFQRLGDTTAVEGTGLGLAVARGFTELMGGALRIEDTPGGGTTIVLAMPRADLDHPSGDPQAPCEPAVPETGTGDDG